MVVDVARLVALISVTLAVASCSAAAEPESQVPDPASLTEFTPDALEPLIGGCGVTGDKGFNYVGVDIAGHNSETLILSSLPYPDTTPQTRLRAIEDADVACVLAALGAPQSALDGLEAVRVSHGVQSFAWDQFSATIEFDDMIADLVQTKVTLR